MDFLALDLSSSGLATRRGRRRRRRRTRRRSGRRGIRFLPPLRRSRCCPRCLCCCPRCCRCRCLSRCPRVFRGSPRQLCRQGAPEGPRRRGRRRQRRGRLLLLFFFCFRRRRRRSRGPRVGAQRRRRRRRGFRFFFFFLLFDRCAQGPHLLSGVALEGRRPLLSGRGLGRKRKERGRRDRRRSCRRRRHRRCRRRRRSSSRSSSCRPLLRLQEHAGEQPRVGEAREQRVARQGREAKHRAPGNDVERRRRRRRRSAFFFFVLGRRRRRRRRCCCRWGKGRGKGERRRGFALFPLSLLFHGRQGLENNEGFGRRRRERPSLAPLAEAAAAAFAAAVVRRVFVFVVFVAAPLAPLVLAPLVHDSHAESREIYDPVCGRGRGRRVLSLLLFAAALLGRLLPVEEERVPEAEENSLPPLTLLLIFAPSFLLLLLMPQLLAFLGGLIGEVLLLLLEGPAGEVGRVGKAGLEWWKRGGRARKSEIYFRTRWWALRVSLFRSLSRRLFLTLFVFSTHLVLHQGTLFRGRGEKTKLAGERTGQSRREEVKKRERQKNKE